MFTTKRHWRVLGQAGLQGTPALFYPGSHVIEFWPVEDGPPAEQFSLLSHERIHYLHAVGTTFGCYYADTVNLRAGILLDGATRLAQEHGELWLTLRDWREDVDDPSGNRSEKAKLLNRTIWAADRLDNALARFLGIRPESPPGLMGYTRGFSLQGSHYARIAPPRDETSPKLSSLGGGTLGAAHLMETFALYWQVFTESHLDGGLSSGPEAFAAAVEYLKVEDREVYVLYAGAAEYALELLGPAGYWVLPALIDAALCGPMPRAEEALQQDLTAFSIEGGRVESVRVDGIKPEHAWEDVHPGWRFVRAVEALRESALPARVPGLIGRWDILYEEVISVLTRELSWKAPWEAAAGGVVGRSETAPAHVELLRESREEAMQVRRQEHARHAYGPYQAGWMDLSVPPVFISHLLPGGVVAHVEADRARHHLFLHVMNHWADVLLPQIIEEDAAYDRSGAHWCPLATQNFDFICSQGKDIKAACSAGRFPPDACAYSELFRKQFGIPVSRVRRVRVI